MYFGLDNEQAVPGAYGIVGYVEASGSWWLLERAMPRERIVEMVCAGVWHLLEGIAHDHGVTVAYEEPLPIGALAAEVST